MKALLCGALALLGACMTSVPKPPPGPLVWVNVRTIELVGVDEKDRAPILALQVPLASFEGGFVEGRESRRQVLLTIADLGSGAERRLEGSAIQTLVETIAGYYARQERMGASAEVMRSDFERVLQGDTCLRIRIKDPSKTPELRQP